MFTASGGDMRAIDLHAHLTPQCFQREVLAGRTWHGMTNAEGELFNPMNAWTPEQRLADMDSLGVDIQVVSTNVNGRTFDEPAFLPFWKAAEQMGALIFIHQARPTLVTQRTPRYHLPNTLGNLADRAVTFASFVFGGVMDACPDLKICLAHGGGYTCFGIGRMDRGWQVRSEARVNIQRPPSAYLNKFYYDCLTHSEAALQMLIDTVGIDKVIFGTDWPADMAIDWPVSWILSLKSLRQEEKEAIDRK